MLGMAFIIRTSEKGYVTSLAIFLLFECSCILVAFLAVIRTFKLEYGSEFRRKIYIKNPKTHKIDTFFDDGSYVFQKENVIGRIHLEDNIPDSAISVDGHQES